MDERITKLEQKMAEMMINYKNLLEEVEKLKAESTEGGIILDGCNDEVKNYINSVKKEADI